MKPKRPDLAEEVDVTTLPWCSQRWAAEYLGVNISTIWRRMIPHEDYPDQVKGKIRFRIMANWNKRRQPRLLRSDVYAILPPPVGKPGE